jgi:tyrosine-protein kinase Etk/Wzc
VSLAAKRAQLIRSLREREAELAPLPGIERELKRLELDVKVALNAYEVVDKEFQEAEIKKSYPMPEVRLISLADPPELPTSPNRIQIVAVALLGGLVVGVALAMLLEYLNRRVRGIRDVEDFVGLKVLATIPRVSRSRWRRAGLS